MTHECVAQPNARYVSWRMLVDLPTAPGEVGALWDELLDLAAEAPVPPRRRGCTSFQACDRSQLLDRGQPVLAERRLSQQGPAAVC
jgi:hypothetical protein